MSSRAALAALLWLGVATPGVVRASELDGQPEEVPPVAVAEAPAEEQPPAGDDEETRTRALLPFTRALGANGVVAGSLTESAAAAGVPPVAMLDAERAFKEALDRPAPQDGDRFYVRWEQTYSIDGRPIGVARLLWLELRTPGGGVTALHRFQPRAGAPQYFFADGEVATMPTIALPIDELTITSPFGLRPDPFRRGGWVRRPAGGPAPDPRSGRTVAVQAYSGFMPRLYMHDGVDFAVQRGTPVYAAADGVVAGARFNGGYGIWVRLDHGDGIATVYGHLSRFAPHLKEGMLVARGQLIAYSGSTGRSTGPHLHFEVLSDETPIDPLTHSSVTRLTGKDLERFTKQMADSQRERDSEAAVSRPPEPEEPTAAE